MAETEEWKEIPGYEGLYSVSNLGRVRRDAGGQGARAGRILKPRANGIWSFNVCLRKDGKPRSLLVHRLVMLAFVGPCPEGLQVAHGDGNPSNNRLENLRYASPTENMLDCHRYGGRTASQKLLLEQVAEARRRSADGESDASIARRFGVHANTIYRIRTGRRWAHRLDQTLLESPTNATA